MCLHQNWKRVHLQAICQDSFCQAACSFRMNFIRLFSMLVDPTWTLLGKASCLTTRNLAVEIFAMTVPFCLSFNMLQDLYFWNKY